jgi:ABC-type methionine transport system ATPase subunit
MAKIEIEIENIEDAAQACREVADAIEQGYMGGIIGYSGDTWGIED